MALRTLFIPAALLAVLLILGLGCARVPYKYGWDIEKPLTLRLAPGESQMEMGPRVPVLDALGHYVFSLPGKLLLWNWSVDNHHITPETVAALEEFLQANELYNVKVRLNQYEPRAEWRRLGRNHAVHPFWRFTLGGLNMVFYTIFPGRLFGGDNYNPYTNTINLYSDHPAIALHEAGHAKDFARMPRAAKGWYAAIRLLPLAPLYQEGWATGDTIGYTRIENQPRREKSAYKILYPAYCTYIAGEGLRWFSPTYPIAYGITFLVTIPGHVVGRIKAAFVKEPQPQPYYPFRLQTATATP